MERRLVRPSTATLVDLMTTLRMQYLTRSQFGEELTPSGSLRGRTKRGL